MNSDDLITKRIGILGWGVNHRGLAAWLTAHRATHVSVLDEWLTEAARDPSIGIRDWRFGPTAFNHLTDFDLVVRSPGIPLTHPKLTTARAAGVAISSQTRLFFEFCPAQTIGVTGTKGKGTTASIIHTMIDEEGKRQKAKGKSVGSVYLAGNIGRDPFEFLDELTPDDWVVLELSSFQLEDLDRSPHVAVVLTVSEDHLDHHRSAAEYRTAKEAIVAHQRPTDHAILHADDPISRSFAERTRAQIHWFSRTKSVADGAAVVSRDADDWFVLTSGAGEEQFVAPTAELQLRGPHNQENAAAALVAASLAGVSTEAMATTLRSFRPLPHRLETVGTIDAVQYVNDSYATAPLPTIAALRSFAEPIVLILGGQGKGADYTELMTEIRVSSVRVVVCYGSEGQRFEELLKQSNFIRQVVYERIFDDAFSTAWSIARPGDVVLLSPSATSYDQFVNYTERGNRFRELVTELDHGA